jgi:condensin complex subunit 1
MWLSCFSNDSLLAPSSTFCDSQLVRSNLMVATGDLAIRFPNLVDPWTPHLYAR